MQKIILDINIVVSALIQKSYPHYIVYDYVLNEQLQLCLSEPLLNEYRDVLSRPKFAQINNFVYNAEIVLNRFIKIARFFEPVVQLNIIKDKSDNKLLELVDESNTDYLVTGNSIDFTTAQYKNTQILSPRGLWEILTQYK
jgi:putative PIN family toxin of toxin-antitoxin system